MSGGLDGLPLAQSMRIPKSVHFQNDVVCKNLSLGLSSSPRQLPLLLQRLRILHPFGEMKMIRVAIQSFNNRLSCRIQPPQMIRSLSTSPISSNETDDNQSTNSFESTDDFEQRIFGGISGSNPNSDSFYQKLDRLKKTHDVYGLGSKPNGGRSSQFLDGLDESFNTLSDGMDWKLKKEATYFEFNPEEIEQEYYAFRPDMTFRPGMTYEPKDLDLRKPGVRKPFKRQEFEVTTEEVLRKADFRNVRFLANFITEAGIIIKRSKTGISAKAQRKVAREIKTARAFGLLPFTTMGTKAFVFGKTMEDLDEDFEYYRSVDPEETPEETQDTLELPLEP